MAVKGVQFAFFLVLLYLSIFPAIISIRHVNGVSTDNVPHFLPNDMDGDGLNDSYEEMLGSDPTSNDTDMDGLNDSYEVLELGSDPTSNDTDMDGLNDSYEVLELDSDPTSNDTDMDGLNDSYEVLELDSDPTSNDTDMDGLNDSYEVLELDSDPTSNDTDMDGLKDEWEVTYKHCLGVDILSKATPIDLLYDQDNDHLSLKAEAIVNSDPCDDTRTSKRSTSHSRSVSDDASLNALTPEIVNIDPPIDGAISNPVFIAGSIAGSIVIIIATFIIYFLKARERNKLWNKLWKEWWLVQIIKAILISAEDVVEDDL